MGDVAASALPDLKEAIAVLRQHLDVELTEADSQGRYVIDFEAMTAVVEAIDEIETAFAEIDEAAGDDE